MRQDAPMRCWYLALAFLALGCTNAPEMVWLGQFESPCNTSADCESGPCLILEPGNGICTESCQTSCTTNYTCDATQHVCVPSGGGMCRASGAPCGAHYPVCCGGLDCVQFDGWGTRCARVGCTDSYGCSNEFCCVPSGNTTVCAPPTFCP